MSLSSPMRPMSEWFDERVYVDPFWRGAAVAFGLMGMAEAIREQQVAKAVERWRTLDGHVGVPASVGSPDRSVTRER